MGCVAGYPSKIYARYWQVAPAIIVEGEMAWSTHHDSESITLSRFTKVV